MSKFDATDLDDLLGQFFKAELPATWPACPVLAEPSRARPRVVSPWARVLPRLALAASLALLLFGYATLSQHFPQEIGGGFSFDAGSDVIGHRESSASSLRSVDELVSPQGRGVRILEEELDGGAAGVEMIIETLPTSPQRR